MTHNQQIVGVDLGVNNLMAVTKNQTGVSPFLIKCRPLKAINTSSNKQRSCLQYQLKTNHNKTNYHRSKNNSQTKLSSRKLSPYSK
nr:transposase [Okeania sp. SIO3I5]